MSTLKNITGFYQAHSSNYTPGRAAPIRAFTVHHSAGFEETLRYLWANPNRNASSTFYVSGSVREQYVQIEDTPWTNANFDSNSESLTCEVRGDWRNGYYDQATLNNLTEVMYQCLKLYPNLVLNYHQDVARAFTECPADLKHKGYAANCWQNAKNRIAVENQAAQTPAVNLRTDIADKKVILIRDANLWDMSFTTWAGAKAVKALPKGTVIDVAGVYNHQLGGQYYLSNYSWNNGINNGINVKDCEDYVEPAPVPTPEPTPIPEPTPVPVPTPPKEEGGSGTLPPVPVDPQGNPIEKRVSALEALVQKIVDFLSSIFTNFKK